eukprot:2580368-Karenia_brevis.AAC.1
MGNDYYFQSVKVSVHHGGRFWRVPSDGSCWMGIGENGVSSVCARIVQVSYGMRREDNLKFLEQLGKVIGI